MNELIANAIESALVFLSYPYWMLLVLVEEEGSPVNKRSGP